MEPSAIFHLRIKSLSPVHTRGQGIDHTGLQGSLGAASNTAFQGTPEKYRALYSLLRNGKKKSPRNNLTVHDLGNGEMCFIETMKL